MQLAGSDGLPRGRPKVGHFCTTQHNPGDTRDQKARIELDESMEERGSKVGMHSHEGRVHDAEAAAWTPSMKTVPRHVEERPVSAALQLAAWPPQMLTPAALLLSTPCRSRRAMQLALWDAATRLGCCHEAAPKALILPLPTRRCHPSPSARRPTSSRTATRSSRPPTRRCATRHSSARCSTATRSLSPSAPRARARPPPFCRSSRSASARSRSRS